MTAPHRYGARVEALPPRAIRGHCYDPDDLSQRIVVEMIIDGVPLSLARADSFVLRLIEDGIGDGRHGFSFWLTPEQVAAGGRLQVGIANGGPILAPPLDLATLRADGPALGPETGHAAWPGGLRITGWLEPGLPEETPRVRARIDGLVVVEGPALRWRHVADAADGRPRRAFDLQLPAALADGQIKHVAVETADGRPLRGSPLTLLAFPDPLEDLVALTFGEERGDIRERARLIDRLSPSSTPFGDLTAWLARHPLPAGSPATVPGRTIAVAIVGDDDAPVDATVQSLEAEGSGTNWVAAALPSPDGVSFRGDDLAAFLDRDGSGADRLLAIRAGSRLRPGALSRFAAAPSDARLVYADIAIGPEGQEAPIALPSFDRERWLEQGYGALAFAMPLEDARHAARSGADSLYRLALHQIGTRRGPGGIIHLPGIAARGPPLDREATGRALARATADHLHQHGTGTVSPGRSGAVFPAVRVSRPASGRVTVIVPTRDRPELLEACLASIEPALVRTGADVIVVDNDSSDPAAKAAFATLRRRGHRVLGVPGPFNFSRLCNRAVAEAGRDFVCLLNNDIVAGDAGWLEELLSRAAEPDVDVVGAVLRRPSGLVQHGGVVLGPGLSAAHAFDDRMADECGYGDLLQVTHEPSAVTAACMLVRRAAYQAVGGMDETHFAIDFNDVDLCLKVGARGGRVVLTPHLDLVHRGSASRGAEPRPDQLARHGRERAALRARWGATLAADPAYSPLLALTDEPYVGLASPPRDLAPRERRITPPRPIPVGL